MSHDARSPSRPRCSTTRSPRAKPPTATRSRRSKEQSDLVELLEKQLQAARDANDMQIEQLSAQLQREQLERSMAEGALEAGRKDIARLLREIAALQYRPVAATPAKPPPARQPICAARPEPPALSP